MLRET